VRRRRASEKVRAKWRQEAREEARDTGGGNSGEKKREGDTRDALSARGTQGTLLEKEEKERKRERGKRRGKN